MLFELTLRRSKGELSINSPVDGIRILALMPGRWRKDLRQSTGDIIIRVYTDDTVTNAQIRAEVRGILTNPEVSHWELVSCNTLTVGDHTPKLNQWVASRRHGQRAQWN
ncbi:hypothetical protein [Sphaerisporangium sp. TRM90804]|uniref:hypothetical protein n=1 Tax=Sphaerisporangium sp. TRM90804 TaxID=3031113 RepID=UPI00244ADBF7|nr:hypothetical protein [Sphaerisporangium sp. TRM90804]MDH2424473.1 hypothetical protein [Sphaerisporangium sp. TRM90804]